MYQHFQNLRNRENRVELRAFIRDSNVEELVKIIRNSISKLDAPKILDDILQEFSDSEACQLKRRVLMEAVLNDLGNVKISAGQVDAIVNRMIVDFPKYSKQHLVKLVDFCLASIRNSDDELHSWKDLLPVLLEMLENEKYIVHMGAQVSGDEYKSLIVKAICNYRWNVNLLPSLAKMFGEMTLDRKTDRNQVLKALCSTLADLSLDQIPPFVYQMLKLCRDRESLYLLDALNKYFQSCYSKAVSHHDKDSLEDIGIIGIKQVQDIESTVLYYLYQAAQLNHENMKDFIRYLKNVSSASEYILQPFMLAVLISISSIYEEQIFEILRSTIVNSSLEKEKRKGSAWLRQLIPSSCNIIRVVRQIIECSNKDRHLILKGFINLAFALMNSDQKLKNNGTIVWCIGGEIIREVIKKRHETVATVMQELVNKIVAGGTSITHYIDCLNYACRELSLIVLDHQIWIIILLERLLFLPDGVANQVLYAIFPLMRVSSNIRENLLLTLRKALYRKGVSKRQMAVTGFLEMLKYSKMHSLDSFRLSQRHNSSLQFVTSSSSSSSSSLRSTLTQATLEYSSQRDKSECEKTLCYEILDILKKSFTYEFQVRLHLYEGLYDTVMKNSEITEIVLDMLLAHLNLYVDTDDDVLPPVKFDLCTNVLGTEIVPQEPIAELIFALQKIYVGTMPRKSVAFDKVRDALELMCRKMIATQMEHLSLEHETDLFGDLSKSQIKVRNLGMAITIYEALMAFRIGECLKGNLESFRKIDDLFKGYTRSVDFIKMQSTKMKKLDNNKAKKNKDMNNTTRKFGKSNSIKLPNTIMDLDVIRQSLTLLYSRSFTVPEEVAFQENSNFRCYIFQTCEQLLQREKLITNASRKQNDRYVNAYIEIAGLLYKHLVSKLNDILENNDQQTAVLALQCFKEISCCACTSLSHEELSRFLDSILLSRKDTISKDLNLKLEEIIFSLKCQLESSLVEERNIDERKKIPFFLLEIIEQFTYKINFENYHSEKILEWFRKITQMENVENSIVSGIMQFFLRLEEYTEEYGESLHEICLELCEKVGAIDDVDLNVNKQYKVIREDTALQIYNVLNGCIKEKLNNVSWLLMRLKAEDTVVRASGTISEIWNNSLREKERNLCKQLSRLAQILCTLANTSIDPGPCTDVTFKNLQYLYHLLGNLTKYFYVKSNGQNVAFQAVKFIQVVQLAGKPLKSAFYNLVTYVEENQNKARSKSDSHAQRNKILKETKVIPRVVYEIEQFNKEILLLGKKTSVPLENYMKRSVTRDFRIKNPQLVEDLEKMDVSLEQLDSSNSENTDNENQSLNADGSDDDTNETKVAKKRPRMEDENALD
ncbi:Fanconi anemia group I protein isoform X1 [Osmia bicornis bicornis]|uniref:Fanconi anemia group I protein isoform X1 n=1 Tax=Osmia bicornis bicornis TaxID=1437191 RepID=UPI001EAE9141|nr:Fanconi anemia group I protein isoform X1 [Osmia bicornis bicornis]